LVGKKGGSTNLRQEERKREEDKEQNEQNFERKQKATLNQHLPEKSLVVNLCF